MKKRKRLSYKEWVSRQIELSKTTVDGETCGKWLYVIAKIEAGLPLSSVERDLVADVLREELLTKQEMKDYRRWRELQHYEATKRLAEYAIPRGKRAAWIQSLYGKSKQTLLQYFSRIRTGK